jgi:NADH-quinone oxidoreductase subunit M
VAAGAATGVILSAAYALWLYRRVVMGDLIKESLKTIKDMTAREKAIFAPLVVMTIWMGVYPAPILDRIGPSVEALVSKYDMALESAGRGGDATQVAESEH